MRKKKKSVSRMNISYRLIGIFVIFIIIFLLVPFILNIVKETPTLPDEDLQSFSDTSTQVYSIEETKDDNVQESEENNQEAIDDNDFASDTVKTITEKLNLSLKEENLPVQVEPSTIEGGYSKTFFWQSDRILKGVFSTTGLYFEIPEYWETQSIYAKIIYEVSPLINGEFPASLTFMLNNKPIHSFSIQGKAGQTQVAYVPIPVTQLKKGFNLLDIQGYVKIFDYEGCSEDYTNANWVNIGADSFIHASYNAINHRQQISSFPYPFVSTLNQDGAGMAVMVSDIAANGELAAAFQLMAHLSKGLEKENKIEVGRYKELAYQSEKKIMISLKKNLPLELKDKIDLSEDLSNLAKLYFLDDNGDPFLLIISDKEECLYEAVYLLMDKDRVAQEKTSVTYVKIGISDDIIKARSSSSMVIDKHSIEGLVGEGLFFVGPFHQEKVVFLPSELTNALIKGGEFNLQFRYSENLDFNRSLITVFWGDKPIASKKLYKEKAKQDEFIFPIPEDLIGTSASNFKIAFDLEIQDLFCTPRTEQMPWAYVTGDSTVYLPIKDKASLSFTYIPTPFQKSGMFSDVLVITPELVSKQELSILGKTLALYGQNVKPYGDVKVIGADEFLSSHADYNIITVGNNINNSFIKAINSDMSCPFNRSGSSFIGNDELIMSEYYGRNIAVLQLLKSPFSENKGILVVGASNAKNMSYAKDLLVDFSKRPSIIEDCVLVDQDLDVMTYKFIDDLEKTKKIPEIWDVIEKNKDSLIFVSVAAGALLMLLLALMIILYRIRRNQKNQDLGDDND